MVIALYGNTIDGEHLTSIELLLAELAKHHAEVIVYAPFYSFIEKELGYKPPIKAIFRTSGEVKHFANFMISIGGDGTFLESVSYIEDSCIPVVGINFGRLGFLAHISSKDIAFAVDQIFKGEYTVENHTALRLSLNNNPFKQYPFALNDITIQKKGTTMITINTHINDEFLCTYWADGIIVSTPTGSTAYSLSVGGPVVSPLSQTFVISPIAPHNLTVRPLVIPDDSVLSLEMETRDGEILLSLDSRSIVINNSTTIKISKAPFCVGLVRLKGSSYYKTLRNKLMWGADSRNKP
ncbi:MAG: NAD kinase [Bacteroidales bacterium]